MLAATGSEPVREPEEVFLLDRVEYGDNRTLDNFVLQRRDSQRALLAPRLRYKPSPDRQRPVRAAMDSRMQVEKIAMVWKGRDSNPRPRHYECRGLSVSS